MKVSIAMCTYNGAKYIREQLDSILRQTEKDWELVVCDDCSKDDTLKILHEYADRDARIHVYQNASNLGFFKNFEKALGLCQGDYIAPCDQDDIWTANHLEKLLTILGDKTLACGNSELVDANGKSLGLTLSEQEHLYRVPNDPLDLALSIFLCRNPFQGASMLFRRNFLRKALPFPEELSYHDTWFSGMACFMEGISYSYDCITKYRIHGGNASGEHQKKLTKVLVKRALKSQFWRGRDIMLNAVRERNVVDCTTKTKRWQEINRILNNQHNKKGKIRNLPYMLAHIRSIISI